MIERGSQEGIAEELDAKELNQVFYFINLEYVVSGLGLPLLLSVQHDPTNAMLSSPVRWHD